VTSGEFATERLVASPVQVLRAAMRLYESVGRGGFTLCVMDAYTGAWWGELVGQQRHEYDSERREITDNPCADGHTPPILPWFTFHEGWHTHSTWLTEDSVPEVARRARLGKKMRGIAQVYDHVTPVMRKQVLDVLKPVGSAPWRR
jgi:hypothetical protein